MFTDSITKWAENDYILRVKRDEDACSKIRLFLRRFMLKYEVPEHAAFDVEVLSGEAVSNAYRYGKRDIIVASFEIRRRPWGGRVLQSYSYYSDRYDTRGRLPDPSEGRTGGRGLYLMHSLSSTSPTWFFFNDGTVNLNLNKIWYDSPQIQVAHQQEAA